MLDANAALECFFFNDVVSDAFQVLAFWRTIWKNIFMQQILWKESKQQWADLTSK